MKKLLFLIVLTTLTLSARSEELRNPILPGFHPDPSICRVDGKFYLVNSSFNYFPGVPIYESLDLVNWRQVGNVLSRPSQLPLGGATSWLGIYAPTLRYNNGTWYMVTTNVGNGGNFLVTAPSPEGPWSEPVWLKQQGIDPSLYFEDGRCYMCSNPGDAIWLCEIDPTTGRQLTESRMLWQGDGGRYPEGPHIYKKDDYYYLLISEGGTELAHHLTIARSTSIYGPYESNPGNPILTNCSRLGQGKQIQGTGHGDLVDDGAGNWWVVFLAYRNFGGSYHHLGRETCLAPVTWTDEGWPVVNGGQPIDTLMTVDHLPAPAPWPQAPADGRINPADPAWLYLQNPIAGNYRFAGGTVELTPHGTLTGNDRPTYLGRRQTRAVMTAETEVKLLDTAHNNRAGLSVYQINDGHFDLYLTHGSDGWKAGMSYRLKSLQGQAEQPVRSGTARLRITSDGNYYDFLVSDDGGATWKALARHECSLLSTEVAGGFTGVSVGMFCEGDPAGKATFGYYNMK